MCTVVVCTSVGDNQVGKDLTIGLSCVDIKPGKYLLFGNLFGNCLHGVNPVWSYDALYGSNASIHTSHNRRFFLRIGIRYTVSILVV